MKRAKGVELRLEGPVGDRIKAGVEQWLLTAPDANPGMLAMMTMRDRRPAPEIMPWAGEFVGKYLMSAIQTLNLVDDKRLTRTVRATVRSLIASQASDGYLGPFPKAQRLKANWDLWGHYHCMMALLMWHERTGDAAALACCRRAADLICATYLGGDLRVFDAGSHEMNMAVIHAFTQLYRVTKWPRYLTMAKEIEKDWERAGDYLRTGAAGVEFWRTPRPRWESLPDLQALLDLHAITGDGKYLRSAMHHWRSIARRDIHNSGSFSAGEQATGDPWAPGAIETCCTTAWVAYSVDVLRATGDPAVADVLELATLNAVPGSQHPSGRWFTYNTPMDGVREASAHTIVFQAKAGTPELNCCSVNGPRGFSLLAEWACIEDGKGLTINWLGAGKVSAHLPDGSAIGIRTRTRYPADGLVEMEAKLEAPRRAVLRVRIPGWARTAAVAVNGKAVKGVSTGSYAVLDRVWRDGDKITLQLDMGLRCVPGGRSEAGCVSLFRGPLLLAYDQRFNAMDEADLPAIPADALKASLVAVPDEKVAPAASLAPWVVVDVRGEGGKRIRLCDFATAGQTGARYRTWLRASNAAPSPCIPEKPLDASAVPAGAITFRWAVTQAERPKSLRVVVSAQPRGVPLIAKSAEAPNSVTFSEMETSGLPVGRPLFWGVEAADEHGATWSLGPDRWFKIDPSLKPEPPRAVALTPREAEGYVIFDPLAGEPKPEAGQPAGAPGTEAARGRQGRFREAVQTNGVDGKVAYRFEEFPGESFTLSVDVCIDALPEGRIGQVFSAWAVPMDDPIRICISDGKVAARIESGNGFATPGVPVTVGKWMTLAVVKDGPRLTLYVDGAPGETVTVPGQLYTSSTEAALGSNPKYVGDEHLKARFSNLSLRVGAHKP